MTHTIPKVPNDTILQYIRDTYRYEPFTGILSKNGKPAGYLRKKDNRIILPVQYGSTSDGSQLSYTTYAHQVAWYLAYEVWPSRWIDHINGDATDNRLSNLRLVTPGQNGSNQRKVRKTTTSKFKGVTKVKGLSKPWRAYITLQGKRIELGYYATELEAGVAYDTKAIEVFGTYAMCNLGQNSATSGHWEQLLLPWG